MAEELKAAFAPYYWKELVTNGRKPGKYQADLWRANEIIFLESGLRKENIHTTNICTMCNSDKLFSHRTVGEERGNLAAFLGLN